MNKTIVGATFTLCGTILFSAILISGAIYSATMDSWSGSSKFWFAILGKATPEEDMYTMGLTFIFCFAIALFLFGVTCLFWDRLNKALKSEV